MTSIAKRPPLYQEASTQLLQRIAKKEWRSGTPLPNELELSAEMGVSVGTIRRALDKLEADRLVVRLQGRGTFVSEQACEEFATRFNNVRDAKGRPLSVVGSVLYQVAQEPSELEGRRLKLKPGERILRTRRLLSNASRLYMHEQAVLSLKHFRDVASEAIGDYALSVLAFNHGIALGCAHEHVTLCRVPDDIGALMGLEPGAPVLSSTGRSLRFRTSRLNGESPIVTLWMKSMRRGPANPQHQVGEAPAVGPPQSGNRAATGRDQGFFCT